jgi:hypothetical protein
MPMHTPSEINRLISHSLAKTMDNIGGWDAPITLSGRLEGNTRDGFFINDGEARLLLKASPELIKTLSSLSGDVIRLSGAIETYIEDGQAIVAIQVVSVTTLYPKTSENNPQSSILGFVNMTILGIGLAIVVIFVLRIFSRLL